MSIACELLIGEYQKIGSICSFVHRLWDDHFAVGCDLRLAGAGLCEHYPLLDRTTGLRANREQIDSYFSQLQSHGYSGQLPQDYYDSTPWILSHEFLLALQIQTVATLHNNLGAVYEHYYDFPNHVQAALLDLNLHFGIEGFLSWNEPLLSAIDSEQWEQCAQLCGRSTVSAERNAMLTELFSALEGNVPSTNSSEFIAVPPSPSAIHDRSDDPQNRISDGNNEHGVPESSVSNSSETESTAGKYMLSDWKTELIHELKVSEGCIDHLYCDSVGYVTIGVGCMLPNAKAASALPLRLRGNGQLASEEEKEEAFFDVKGAYSENTRASYYKDYSQLYLDEKSIEQELLAKVEGFIQQLVGEFANFDSYPNQAKMAILDMAYNLGVVGITKKFPTFTRYVRSQDWANCANECRRKQLSQSRNDWVKNLFLSVG